MTKSKHKHAFDWCQSTSASSDHQIDYVLYARVGLERILNVADFADDGTSWPAAIRPHCHCCHNDQNE